MNSSWTDKHIRDIWKCDTVVVYPPCDMARLLKIPTSQNQKGIISIGQFRPEKNHTLQIMSVAPVLKLYPSVTFKIVGSCRNEADRKRVEGLRTLIDSLDLGNRITLLVNGSEEEVRNALSEARVGLHTMTDEHFGIGVIEYMAAGVIAVAHNSGGPRDDILVNNMGKPVGFLATTKEEYTTTLMKIFKMTKADQDALIRNARVAVEERFSTNLFNRGILDGIRYVERI